MLRLFAKMPVIFDNIVWFTDAQLLSALADDVADV